MHSVSYSYVFLSFLKFCTTKSGINKCECEEWHLDSLTSLPQSILDERWPREDVSGSCSHHLWMTHLWTVQPSMFLDSDLQRCSWTQALISTTELCQFFNVEPPESRRIVSNIDYWRFLQILWIVWWYYILSMIRYSKCFHISEPLHMFTSERPQLCNTLSHWTRITWGPSDQLINWDINLGHIQEWVKHIFLILSKCATKNTDIGIELKMSSGPLVQCDEGTRGSFYIQSCHRPQINIISSSRCFFAATKFKMS